MTAKAIDRTQIDWPGMTLVCEEGLISLTVKTRLGDLVVKQGEMPLICYCALVEKLRAAKF